MDWSDLNLWKHQKEAIKKSSYYLREYRNDRCQGAALVRMPTGTGKSGIIAILSCLEYVSETALVLVPSKKLKEQIARKIKLEFWNTIGSKKDDDKYSPPFHVVTFKPKTLNQALDKATKLRTTLVCTVQTLEAIHRPIRTGNGDRSGYNKLKDTVGYLLFDEGHREPAPAWAKACRDFNKPTVLFSATPYRNDFKLFDVNSEFIYNFKFKDAIDRGFIRDIRFKFTNFDTVSKFAEKLINYYNNQLKNNLPKGVDKPKVIVRCNSKQEIIKVTEEIRSLEVDVIGIHYDLPNTDYYYNSVPELNSHPATFYVHQFMLVEGVDNPDFCLLAIYNSFSNARSLVQQIGRIIRNPGQKKDQYAFVFNHNSSKQEQYWDKYLVFERDATNKNMDIRSLFLSLYNKQPSVRYINGNFRTKFDFTETGLYKKYRYPKKANVWRIISSDQEENWKPKELAKEISISWQKKDRFVFKTEYPDTDTIVITYLSARNSPILLKNYFLEQKLGFTVCHKNQDFIFYYDSGQATADALERYANKINHECMKKLFPSGSRTTSVSLKNTDIGQNSLRRRTLHAKAINNIAPDIVDHTYFPSTLRAYVPKESKDFDDNSNKNFKSRYIGFSSARISERAPSKHGYYDFIRWIDKHVNALKKEAISDTLIQRYATYIKPPEDPTPRHIMLDIVDILDENRYLHKETDEPLDINKLIYSIDENKFKIQANGSEYEVHINYDINKDKYILTNKELDSNFTLSDETPKSKRSLLKYINYEQSFRIIPEIQEEENWIVYANGNFYSPNNILRTDTELIEIFRPVEELSIIKSEKGSSDAPATSQKWHETSIFNLIDSKGQINGNTNSSQNGSDRNENNLFVKRLSNLDILICDDMSREVADFIGLDRDEKRIIFIHAKYSSRKLSASGFHDVCGQATKNLDYITPYSDVEPPNSVNLWENAWNNGDVGTVDKRIRKGDGEVEELWKEIKENIRKPYSKREVWIVMGGDFKLNRLKEELNKSAPEPQVIQLYYLLQSTWTAVSSTGADFYIFCPKENN